jgi:hypothetical protein
LAAFIAASATVCWAIAPEGNLVDNLNTDAALVAADPFNDVVRVTTVNGNTVSSGTGCVYMKRKITVGQTTTYFLCVITADHVIAKNPAGVTVDFQNYYKDNGAGVPPTGPQVGTFATSVMGRGINGVAGDTPDIAVLATVVPKSIWDAVGQSPVIPYENNSFLNTFSTVGYGNTGTNIVDGSGNTIGFNEQSGTLGTKRYLNGAVDALSRVNDGVYQYDGLDWNVGLTGGTIMAGDSGAPMFLSNAQNVSAKSNGMAYSTFTAGIVTLADDVNGLYYSNTTDTGVDLTDYAAWVNAKCAALPEPSQIAATAIGLVFFARRRRKK